MEVPPVLGFKEGNHSEATQNAGSLILRACKSWPVQGASMLVRGAGIIHVCNMNCSPSSQLSRGHVLYEFKPLTSSLNTGDAVDIVIASRKERITHIQSNHTTIKPHLQKCTHKQHAACPPIVGYFNLPPSPGWWVEATSFGAACTQSLDYVAGSKKCHSTWRVFGQGSCFWLASRGNQR